MEIKDKLNNVDAVVNFLREKKISYDEGLKIFMLLTLMALAEDKVNAESNKRKYIEVFEQMWKRYRDESKANS